MGFRFQKRIKLLPGVSINLSKSGISTSVGVQGARVTVGHGKTRTTVGLPGTGISHTSIKSNAQPQSDLATVPEYQPAPAQSWQVVIGTIFKTLLAVAGVVLVTLAVLFAAGGKKKR